MKELRNGSSQRFLRSWGGLSSHQSHCSSQTITTPFPTQGALFRFLWVLVRRCLRNTTQSLLQKINQCCKSFQTLWPWLLRNTWHIHRQQYEIRDGPRTPPLSDGFTPRANPIISVCGDKKHSSEVRCWGWKPAPLLIEVWLWANYFTFINLSSLIYEVGLILAYLTKLT